MGERPREPREPGHRRADRVQSHVAIDLGAGSGRVVRAAFGEDGLEFEELARFPVEPRRREGALRWPVVEISTAITAALARAARSDPPVASVGVDSFGCDYGLYDGAGQLIEEPVCYRDARTDGALARAVAVLPLEEIHRATGIQLQPFNTLYQLHAHVAPERWPRHAARLLPLPDLFHRHLCGSDSGERTHASTSQLLKADGSDWNRDLARRFGIPASILPRLVEPGTRLGPLRAEIARECRLEGVEVIAPATHDTASAVAGTPLAEGVAFISSGTWSLVGVERRSPLVNDGTFAGNFTNESGVAGTTRLLKNVCGMWLLEGCRKRWRDEGIDLEWDALGREVERASAWSGVIDPDDPAFFRPDDMVAAVRDWLSSTDQPAPAKPGALARLLLESLALRCADVLQVLRELTGEPVSAIRVIGGGSRNDFLNQALADVTGLPVVAGPVEATALGNLLVQAIASGRFADLAEARAYVAQRVPSRHYQPRNAAAAPLLLARFRRALLRRAEAVRGRA
jgi:rhamnulokinase